MSEDIHKKLKYTYAEVNDAIKKTKGIGDQETYERTQEDTKLQTQIDNITGGDTDTSLSSLKTEITNLKDGSTETIKSLDDKINEIDARSDVVDVVANYTELQNYTKKLTANDVVKVLKDEGYSNWVSYYKVKSASKAGEKKSWTYIASIDQYALQTDLDDETTAREKVASDLSVETSARESADTILNNRLATEETARLKTDSNLSDEITRAQKAESSLSTSLINTNTELTNHTSNTSNPHTVTKAQVGLGDVENTSDSATPVKDGKTKFTTGGAYSLKTELESAISKKEDAISDLSTIRSNAEAGKKASDALNGHTVNSDVPANAKFTDTTYSAVTDSSDGLMTSTQKKKLDGIAEGAEVNVQSDWSTTDSSADSFIKNKPTLSISGNKITIGTNYINVSEADHIHDIQISEFSEDTADISLESGKCYELGICDRASNISFKMPSSTIAAATADDLGAIKTGFTTDSSNRVFAVKLNSSSNAYVDIPYKTYIGSDFISVSSTATYTSKISKSRKSDYWEYNDSSNNRNEDDVLSYDLDIFEKKTFIDYPSYPSTARTCYHVAGDLYLEDCGSVCSADNLSITQLLRFLTGWDSALTFYKVAGTLIYHQEPAYEIEETAGKYIYCYKLFGERDHLLDVPYHVCAERSTSSETWPLYSYYQSPFSGDVTSSGKMELDTFMTFDTYILNQKISFWISFDLYIYGK